MRANSTLLLVSALVSVLAGGPAAAAEPSFRDRAPQDEVIYFLLPDRFENGDSANDTGGLKGGRLKTGFDPSHQAYFHGGDLKGLTARLDYIAGLGATAIWVSPIFQNKPVQGLPGGESAGYHGYWITDFTTVDPHLGSEADFKALVDAAHARGIKVYMDIIANHTADVIKYREGDTAGTYAYRSLGDYPYSRRGGAAGAPINAEFAGDDDARPDNWARLTDPSYAYTPYVPKGEARAKTPAWLNDPIYYHNRGDTFWEGESALYGDFVGLDDLATEHPRVVAGMIEIYESWIDRFGIDGYRIDTAKHVQPAFWRAFVPAMLERAKAKGIANFHIFGEIATDDISPALTARWTREAGLPAVLDMSFASVVRKAVSGRIGTQPLGELFDNDPIYEGAAAAAQQLPVFLSNHDAGRFGMFVKQENPAIGADELLARIKLGHAMLMTLRGVPVIYYGDEQGFVSDGNDQLAREDMFPSRVAVYNDNDLVGTDATTADANFDAAHPLYRFIADLSRVRRSTPALTRGTTTVRAAANTPGLFAASRIDPDTGREVLLAFNTSTAPVRAAVRVQPQSLMFTALAGNCAAAADAPGSVTVDLPPLGFAICAATNGGPAQQ